MTVGDMYSSNTKTVDGADGDEGPEGSPIADASGNGDEPNQLQPNDAIRVTPKPDEEMQEAILADPDIEWTGTRPGGEAPPSTSKTH